MSRFSKWKRKQNHFRFKIVRMTRTLKSFELLIQ